MTTNNLIVITGGKYNDIKKALQDWLNEYQSDIPKNIVFNLYKDKKDRHVITTDARLDNTRFYYLVNYMDFPIGIEHKVEIAGFTTGKDNNILKNKKLHVYISGNDSEGDNVFVTTSENINYKVDFGGRISRVTENKIYQYPSDLNLADPETIRFNKTKISQLNNTITKSKVTKRFKILLSIAIFAYVLNLLILNLPNGVEIFANIHWFLFAGVAFWFFIDYEMLKFNTFYLQCLIIAFFVFIYGYLIIIFFQPIFSKSIFAFSMYPLIFLIVQWPTRRIYKVILKREPKVDGHGKFADLLFTLILFFGFAALPLLIADRIY